MKKFLCELFIFLLVGIVFFNLLSVITYLLCFNRYYQSDNYLWLKNTSNKFIIMGSSTVATGLNADIIQKKLGLEKGDVVNLGLMPTNSIKSYFLLKQHLKHIPDGVTLIYGFDPWVFSEKYYKYDPILYCKWSIKQRIYMFIKEKNISAILGGNVFNELLECNNKSDIFSIPEFFGTKSWSGTDSKVNANFQEWISYPIFKESKLFIEYQQKIEKLIMGKHGLIIYYLPPRRIDWYTYFENHSFNVKVKDIVIRDHETINFEIKYASEIAGDFIDFCHLSNKGRDKISELFSQELKSLIKTGRYEFQ
jgi:hypothetical protein